MDDQTDWVVFVDDEEIVLQSLSAMMSLAGESCEAEFAQSGDEALAIIEELHARGERVSVVIADYIMPAMKGDALLVEVHRRWPHVRTIMLTGQSDMSGVARAINEGNLFRYIDKPFDNQDLIFTIRAAREACLQEIEVAELNAGLAVLNAELQAANEHLEAQVAARTRELATRNVELAGALRTLEDSERIARHDLKAPLGSIEASIALLGDSSGLSAQATQLLDVIRRAAVRARSMVNLSLALRQMETGTFRLAPSPVAIGDVVQQASLDLTAHAKSKGVGFRFDGRDDDLVAGDALLCYSLLANILKNAIEAAPVSSTVTATIRREADAIRIIIHNLGEVPAAIRDRFFAKYSTHGKANGNGLGNYSALLIATAHGGGIDVATSPDAGTTLTITLPALEADAHDQPRAADALQSDCGTGPMHALIVDDEPHNRAVLGAMLRNRGIRVSEADNGRSALEVLASESPDVVFLDIEMPVLGGFATLAAIQGGRQGAGGHGGERRAPRIVAFSAHDDPASVAGYVHAGFDGFVPKPPTAGQLARWFPMPGADIPISAAAPVADEVVVERALAPMFEQFKATRISLFDDLANALQRGDAASAGAIAHKLTGSLAMYGYAALSEACAAITERVRGAGGLPDAEAARVLKQRFLDARVETR